MNPAALVHLTDTAPAHGDPQGAVTIRDLRTDDASAVRAVFEQMSPRSRELRFLAPKVRLSDREVETLTAVDPLDHRAVLALATADRRPVGIARFARDTLAPASAEVGIAVVDAWQGRGVGTALVEALVERALAVGVRRFTAFVSHDNAPVVRLLHGSGRRVLSVDVDRWAAEYVVSLDGEPS